MKKHGITQDTLSYPSDDEDEVAGNPTRGEGNASTANPSCERAWLCLFVCTFLFSFFLAGDGPNENWKDNEHSYFQYIYIYTFVFFFVLLILYFHKQVLLIVLL